MKQKIAYVDALIFVLISLTITILVHYYNTTHILSVNFFSIHEWKLSQYYYSYVLEFMKRGLVDSLFKLLAINPTQINIFIFSILIVVLFFIALFFWFAKNLSQLDPFAKYSIMFLFLISPATAMHLGYDLGRFDVLTLFTTLLMLFLIMGKLTNTKIFFVSLLSAISLLIHEAFLFLNFFIMIAVLLDTLHRSKQSIFKLLVPIFTALTTLILLALFGSVSSSTIDAIYLALTNASLPINEDSIKVLSRSLSDNISITLNQLSADATRDWLIQAFLLYGLYAFIFLKALDVQNKPLNLYEKILFFSPFASLPMFILGIDFFRWVSIMIINLFIVSVYLLNTRTITTIPFFHAKTFKVITFLLTVIIILGPMGIVKVFPLGTWFIPLF